MTGSPLGFQVRNVPWVNVSRKMSHTLGTSIEHSIGVPSFVSVKETISDAVEEEIDDN